MMHTSRIELVVWGGVVVLEESKRSRGTIVIDERYYLSFGFRFVNGMILKKRNAEW
jgi:hypothetical protein